jgi:hypothetical protein
MLAAVMVVPRRDAAERWLATSLAVLFTGTLVSSDSWALGEMPGALLIAVLIVAVPLLLTRVGRRSGDAMRAAVGAVIVVLLLAALGYPEQRSYLEQRYLAALTPPADNPGFRSEEQWDPIQDWARQQHARRIGLVGPPGAFAQYIFYGDDLSNRVRYIGEPGPHGAFRPIENCLQWRHTVNVGEYDFVVITPPLSVGPAASPQEDVWTRGAEGAEVVIDSEAASVYRIHGPLDPERCALAQAPSSSSPWSGEGIPRTGSGLPGRAPLR